MKATNAIEVQKWQDIPNVGPKMERDFVALGLRCPEDLKDADAFTLYKGICNVRGVRLDPCVLDTYMAAVDFMNGAPAKPWWQYTKIRKREYSDI